MDQRCDSGMPFFAIRALKLVSAPSCACASKDVKASRGKVVRAEPVAALYEHGRAHHVGAFPALEDQLIAFTTFGYGKPRSGRRFDLAANPRSSRASSD
jgi:phage terminase large subunit-like protein